MLPDKLDMEIVTPDRRVVAEAVEEIVLPGSQGYFGVRPGHAPLLTSLTVGEITFWVGGSPRHVAVSGGFVEVLRDRVSVLAETAELAEEIDVERAERARQRAEAGLKNASGDDFRPHATRLRRAVTRIRVAGKGS